jgi:DNA-binding HxlR family transcriptional regulator
MCPKAAGWAPSRVADKCTTLVASTLGDSLRRVDGLRQALAKLSQRALMNPARARGRRADHAHVLPTIPTHLEYDLMARPLATSSR